jgi:hypothetical protein
LSFFSFASVRIACVSSLTVMLYWFPMSPSKRLEVIKIMLLPYPTDRIPKERLNPMAGW